MRRDGKRTSVTRTARLVLFGAALLAVASCGTGRSFQLGKQAAMHSDWDLAVTYFDEAVKANPDRADYKMALERAQLAASQVHFDKARTLERQDQLDLAVLEYRKVVQYHAASQEARAKIQELEQTIRDRIEASRPRPPAEAMRQQARKEMEEPALNPSSREPIKLNFPGPGNCRRFWSSCGSRPASISRTTARSAASRSTSNSTGSRSKRRSTRS